MLFLTHYYVLLLTEFFKNIASILVINWEAKSVFPRRVTFDLRPGTRRNRESSTSSHSIAHLVHSCRGGLFAAGALPVYASPLQLNFFDLNNVDSAVYTGDQNNWFEPSCGTVSDFGGYQDCQGTILGNLLTGTRASIVSPILPLNSSGFYFDFLDMAGGIKDIIAINPSDGCLGEVTCGIFALVLSSLNGGALPAGLVNTFSSANIPLAGSVTENGTLLTAFSLTWSDGRTDNINLEVAGVPEPATFEMIAAAALFWLTLARKGIRHSAK